MDSLPWKLRECLSDDESSIHLCSETILLTVCRVPDVICAKQEGVHGDIVCNWPSIL